VTSKNTSFGSSYAGGGAQGAELFYVDIVDSHAIMAKTAMLGEAAATARK
jgi:hypothetical protein